MEDEKIKYLGCEVYQVETEHTGKKVIHIDGYCYWNDESYQLVQGTFCYMDVDGTQNSEKAEVLFSETKQYQGEVTEADVIEYYKGLTPLLFSEVTTETPNGMYINAKSQPQ